MKKVFIFVLLILMLGFVSAVTDNCDGLYPHIQPYNEPTPENIACHNACSGAGVGSWQLLMKYKPACPENWEIISKAYAKTLKDPQLNQLTKPGELEQYVSYMDKSQFNSLSAASKQVIGNNNGALNQWASKFGNYNFKSTATSIGNDGTFFVGKQQYLLGAKTIPSGSSITSAGGKVNSVIPSGQTISAKSLGGSGLGEYAMQGFQTVAQLAQGFMNKGGGQGENGQTSLESSSGDKLGTTKDPFAWNGDDLALKSYSTLNDVAGTNGRLSNGGPEDLVVDYGCEINQAESATFSDECMNIASNKNTIYYYDDSTDSYNRVNPLTQVEFGAIDSVSKLRPVQTSSSNPILSGSKYNGAGLSVISSNPSQKGYSLSSSSASGSFVSLNDGTKATSGNVGLLYGVESDKGDAYSRFVEQAKQAGVYNV